MPKTVISETRVSRGRLSDVVVVNLVKTLSFSTITYTVEIVNDSLSPMNSATPKSTSSTRPPLRAILPALVLMPSVALVLSFIMTWAQVGFGPEFLARWGRGLLTTLLVLPFVLACLGALEKRVDKLLGNLHRVARKLVLAAVTACLIETVIAFAVTAVGHPLDWFFAGYWWLAFSRSLPAGLAIGVFMCFYMKPKLDRMRAAVVLA